MAREIEFRGYDVVGKKGWVFGDLTHTHKVTQTGVAKREMVAGYEVAPESVGQYIGMKDKEGRKIYEGDIVARYSEDCSNCKPEWICYDRVCPQVERMRDIVTLDRFRYWLKGEEFGYEGECLEEPEDCTIIGNVYENPEMAEGLISE